MLRQRQKFNWRIGAVYAKSLAIHLRPVWVVRRALAINRVYAKARDFFWE